MRPHAPTISSDTVGLGQSVRLEYQAFKNVLMHVALNPFQHYRYLRIFHPPDKTPIQTGTLQRLLKECSGIYSAHSRVLNETEEDRYAAWRTVDPEYMDVLDNFMHSAKGVYSTIEARQDELTADGVEIKFFELPVTEKFDDMVSDNLLQFIRACDTSRDLFGMSVITTQEDNGIKYPYYVDPREYLIQVVGDAKDKTRRYRLLQPVLFAVDNPVDFQVLPLRDVLSGQYNRFLDPPSSSANKSKGAALAWIIDGRPLLHIDFWPGANGQVLSPVSRLLAPWCRWQVSELTYRLATSYNADRPLTSEHTVPPMSRLGGGGGRNENQFLSSLQGTLAPPAPVVVAPSCPPLPSALPMSTSSLVGARNKILRQRLEAQAIALSQPVNRPLAMDRTVFCPEVLEDIHNNPRRIMELTGWSMNDLKQLSTLEGINNVLRQTSSVKHVDIIQKDIMCMNSQYKLGSLPADSVPSAYEYNEAEWKGDVSRELNFPSVVREAGSAKSTSHSKEVVSSFRHRLVSRAATLSSLLQKSVWIAWNDLTAEELKQWISEEALEQKALQQQQKAMAQALPQGQPGAPAPPGGSAMPPMVGPGGVGGTGGGGHMGALPKAKLPAPAPREPWNPRMYESTVQWPTPKVEARRTVNAADEDDDYNRWVKGFTNEEEEEKEEKDDKEEEEEEEEPVNRKRKRRASSSRVAARPPVWLFPYPIPTAASGGNCEAVPLAQRFTDESQWMSNLAMGGIPPEPIALTPATMHSMLKEFVPTTLSLTRLTDVSVQLRFASLMRQQRTNEIQRAGMPMAPGGAPNPMAPAAAPAPGKPPAAPSAPAASPAPPVPRADKSQKMLKAILKQLKGLQRSKPTKSAKEH